MNKTTGAILVRQGEGTEQSRKIVAEFPVAAEQVGNKMDELFKEYSRTEEDDPDNPMKMPPIDTLIMMATYIGFAAGAFIIDDDANSETLVREAAQICGGLMSVMMDNAVSAHKMAPGPCGDPDCPCAAAPATNDNATVH